MLLIWMVIYMQEEAVQVICWVLGWVFFFVFLFFFFKMQVGCDSQKYLVID